MKIKIYCKKKSEWYWEMQWSDYSTGSGSYRTMRSALKDVVSELRYLVSVMR